MPPLLRRRRVIAIAVESTPGTAETLAIGDAVLNAYQSLPQPNIEFDEREAQGTFDPLPGVAGAHGGTITFQTDLIGGASPPFWGSVLLPCCGFPDAAVPAGTYDVQTLAPGASGARTKTCTIGVYEDGVLKVLRGCMGTFRIMLTAGKKGVVEFTFTGIFDDPVDDTILAPAFVTVVPPRFASSSLTIGGVTAQCAELVIDANRQVILREDPSDVSGYTTALVTGGAVQGTIDPEAVLVATQDRVSGWKAGTEYALSLSIGSVGNRVAIAGSKLQFRNIQEADRNDMVTDQIEFQMNKNAAAGDDSLTITLD